MKIYKGYLREIVDATIAGDSQRYEFHTDSGDILNLEPCYDMPRNVYCEVHVVNHTITHFNVLALASGQETPRKNIALMLLLAPDESATDAHWKKIRQAATKLQEEYLHGSHYQWDVLVTPYVIEGYTGANSLSSANWNWLIGQVAPEHNYFHVWGGRHPSFCGHAYIGYNRAWTFLNCGIETIIHEQGHNFGLHHSGTVWHEYGEKTWMGMGQSRSGFNAPHQALLEWTTPEAIYELSPNSSATVFLIHSEVEPSARYPGLFKGVRVTKGYMGYYFIGLFQNELRLYRSASSRRFEKTTMLASHRPGQPAPDLSSTDYPSMKILEVKEGVYKVQVSWDSTTRPAPDKPFPEPPVPDELLDLESGLYYEPVFDNQGFDAWFFEDSTALYWYTGDNNGNPIWYLCHQDNEVQGKIRNLKIKDPARPGLPVIGHMKLFSQNENELTAYYNFTDGRVGRVDSIMLAKKSTDSKLYDFEEKDLSGLSETLKQGPEVAYVFEKNRNVSTWYLAYDNGLYKVENVKFRKKTPSAEVRRGHVEWTGDSIEYLNNTFKLVNNIT